MSAPEPRVPLVLGPALPSTVTSESEHSFNDKWDNESGINNDKNMTVLTEEQEGAGGAKQETLAGNRSPPFPGQIPAFPSFPVRVDSPLASGPAGPLRGKPQQDRWGRTDPKFRAPCTIGGGSGGPLGLCVGTRVFLELASGAP